MTNTEIIVNLATIIADQRLEISELKTEVAHLHHELLAMRVEADTPQTERGYMWTCPKCGTENHSDFKKCPCCGYTPQTDMAEDIVESFGFNAESYRQAKAKTEQNSSEKPNNCEHITEDGVTCAKYPACDGCPDNPLNKVKGSERLLKGKDEPQTEDEYITELIKKKCETEQTEQTEPSMEEEKVKCPFTDPIPCEWISCPNSTDCGWK